MFFAFERNLNAWALNENLGRIDSSFIRSAWSTWRYYQFNRQKAKSHWRSTEAKSLPEWAPHEATERPGERALFNNRQWCYSHLAAQSCEALRVCLRFLSYRFRLFFSFPWSAFFHSSDKAAISDVLTWKHLACKLSHALRGKFSRLARVWLVVVIRYAGLFVRLFAKITRAGDVQLAVV